MNTFKLFSKLGRKRLKDLYKKLLSNVVRMYLTITAYTNKTLRKNPLTSLLISKYHNLELNLRLKLLYLL